MSVSAIRACNPSAASDLEYMAGMAGCLESIPMSARAGGGAAARARKPAATFPASALLPALAHGSGGAPARAARIARSAGSATATAQPSLIEVRIAATRALLDGTVGMDGEAVLSLANGVHRDALERPGDTRARELSMALWIEESLHWARAWGEEGAEPRDRLEAYRRQWQLLLDPPPAPRFKSRLETAQGFSRGLEEAAGLDAGSIAQAYLDTPAVIGSYYAQFSSYIESHLDRYCELAVAMNADLSGIGPLRIMQTPRRIWAIDHIAVYARTLNRGNSAMSWLGCGTFIVQLRDGSFGFVDAGGGFKRLHEPILGPDDKPLHAVVLALHGSKPAPAWARTSVGMREVGEGVAPLRDLMADKVKAALLKHVAEWKEAGYDASVLEKVLRLLVPFYEVAHRARHDPGYEFKLKDIAWDVFEVALAFGAAMIGGVGGAAGVRAVLAAGRGAAHGGLRAVVAMAIKTSARKFSARGFVQASARELVDLVVPVFSMADLLRAGKGRLALAPAEGMEALSSAARIGIGVSRPPGMLDEIYQTLVITNAVPRLATVLDLKNAIDAGAGAVVPAKLYRGQSLVPGQRMLHVPVDANASADDYLVACLEHSSRTSGAPGSPMSLTADRSVARRFSAGRDDGVVMSIDTTQDPAAFRTIESIIKHDGPRLVAEKKITPGALRNAVRNVFVEEEREIFYLRGTIPDEMVEIIERSA